MRNDESPPTTGPGGKKNRQKERRLMKGFLSTTASGSSQAAALPSPGNNNTAGPTTTSRHLSTGSSHRAPCSHYCSHCSHCSQSRWEVICQHPELHVEWIFVSSTVDSVPHGWPYEGGSTDWPNSAGLVKYCLIKSHFDCPRMIHDGHIIVVYCF